MNLTNQEKNLPTLYKKKQVWNCLVTNKGEYSEILVSFGQLGGKIQDKVTTITVGKNIGKANETTHFEQACLEAESKWLKQKDKLYREDGEQDDSFSVRPMLAQSYDKHAKKIVFPCYSQRKYDGLRNLATSKGLYSRQGKQFKALDHIQDAVCSILANFPDTVLDGELYSHSLDFQSIISGVKRDEKNEYTSQIEYHVYDCVMPGPYSERLQFLQELLSSASLPLVLVRTDTVNNPGDIHPLHDEYVADGYEGLMLRNAHGVYTPDKRSYDLQKVKSFMDAEFKILAVRADKNNHAVFTCETEDGTEFDVKPQGTDAERHDYLLCGPDLVGQLLTVKFFDWTDSENPVPRFPVGLRIYYD